MLMPYLPGAVFVDLFAGSGAIGIEALSRGAAKAYFVENNQKALICITDNLEHTHLSTKSVVIKQDVFAALKGSIRDNADHSCLFIESLSIGFIRRQGHKCINQTKHSCTFRNVCCH